MGKYIELTGKRFGRLVVISKAYTNKYKQIVWKCQCDCGEFHYTNGQLLREGRCKSCGCLQKENIAHLIQNKIKHNYKKDPLRRLIYGIWKGMKKRCYNPKDRRYHRYGGRGITICDEWINNPQAFVEWALENGYQHGLQIDRIDNNGNYSPDNCRFVTLLVNQHNSSNCKITQEQAEQIRIIYSKGGIKQVDLGKKFGISQQVVSKIINYKLWK